MWSLRDKGASDSAREGADVCSPHSYVLNEEEDEFGQGRPSRTKSLHEADFGGRSVVD